MKYVYLMLAMIMLISCATPRNDYAKALEKLRNNEDAEVHFKGDPVKSLGEFIAYLYNEYSNIDGDVDRGFEHKTSDGKFRVIFRFIKTTEK